MGRLHVITDTRPGRDPVAVARAVLAAGAPVLQVRVADHTCDREAFDLTLLLAELCAEYGATCLVNDRLHVGLAVGVHGGHVGARDLPVHAARAVVGEAAILGGTCRDPETARALRRAGAGYLGVGPAYATSTKDGLPPPLGPHRIGRVAASVDIPVIAIGGVTADRVGELIAAGAHGVAVVGAVSNAADPYA
ncbi:MAG: thiamine phosphate synthase, partial [Stackebrandtia sp.]